MTSPSLMKLEESLCLLLQQKFPNGIITPTHPKKKNEIHQEEFLLVINYVSDSFEGSAITDVILHPTFSFTVYAQSYPRARQFSESAIDFLDTLSGLSFDWDTQKIDVVHRKNRTPVMFDSDSGLYIASVDYFFNLSLKA